MNYENGNQGVYLNEYFCYLFMLLYADDIAQFSDLVWRLQYQINILEKFCQISGMSVNVDKTMKNGSFSQNL